MEILHGTMEILHGTMEIREPISALSYPQLILRDFKRAVEIHCAVKSSLKL